MSHSFDLDAPSALENLKATVEALKVDSLNTDIARTCALQAWHLCEHVFYTLHPESSNNCLRDFQKRIKSECLELSYMQDICNATKHARISNYDPHTQATRVQENGDFHHDDFDPHDFDTPRLAVELHNGQLILFIDVADAAVNFWSSLFDKHGIERSCHK